MTCEHIKAHDHGGRIAHYIQEFKLRPQDVLDFSANINPMGMSPKGKQAMWEALEQVIHYPDQDNRALKEALAYSFDLDREDILVGNGAAELIYALCRLPGFTGVMVPAPGFSEYTSGARAANLPVAPIYYRQYEDEHRFEVPYMALQAFGAKLANKADGEEGRVIVFLTNPNNPDGSLLDVESTLQVATMLAASGSLLVVDESFIEFTDGSHSLRPYIKSHENLVILHSLTKFYAVPGLRIGSLFANPRIIQNLEGLIPCWSVNSLAQAYTSAALADTEYQESSRAFIQEEGKRLYTAYNALNYIQAYRPTANFMLLHMDHPSLGVNELFERLGREGLFIRKGLNFDGLGEGWFRIAIKDRLANDRLLTRIKNILEAS